MLEAFSGLIGTISGYMYSYILIIMLLAVGLYFTFRGKLVQLRLLPESGWWARSPRRITPSPPSRP